MYKLSPFLNPMLKNIYYSLIYSHIVYAIKVGLSCKSETNKILVLNLQKKFNIFHSNVNGLGSKFENLHEFLTIASSNMDIVAITETSQKSNENFIKNVTIEAYDIYSTGSHSARGGVAIYVNNNFNSFERNDLKINNDEFESVWIEINNKGNKNIMWLSLSSSKE